MKVIALLTQKGGSGKTTLAAHLAVAAQEVGEHVAVADMDSQGSARAWKDARQSEMPPVLPVPTAELSRFLAAAMEDGLSLAIIDTAPHAAASVEIVTAASKPAAFILNACPARAPEIEETKEALAAFGLPVAPVTIGERRAFSRAIATGRAVTEFEPRGKASQEINHLWGWIQETIYGQTTRNWTGELDAEVKAPTGTRA